VSGMRLKATWHVQVGKLEFFSLGLIRDGIAHVAIEALRPCSFPTSKL
jgi:hypothetical protein